MSVENAGEPVVAFVSEIRAHPLRRWVEATYALFANPAYCSHCGVYLPKHNRICDPCGDDR